MSIITGLRRPYATSTAPIGFLRKYPSTNLNILQCTPWSDEVRGCFIRLPLFERSFFPMRWSRILILCLFLGTFGYIAITFYTTFHPILAHPSKHGAFNDIMLLAFSPNSPLNGPYQYILLGSMVCMVIVINIEMRTRKSSTHGSARTATSRDMKAFVHPVVRFPRLLFVPLLTKRVLTLRPGSPPPSRLVLGTYHGKAISLTEKQQESNVLLTAPVGAGKSSRVIIPNLLRGQGNRSLFIADVKGELARL